MTEANRILVVGAGPGIGLAVARRFAQEGFEATLICRLRDVGTLKASMPQAHILGADAGDASALQARLDEIEAPEVLLYNASRGPRAAASEVRGEDLDRDLAVNLHAPLRCAQWALPMMRKRGHGTLLFTGGGLGLEPKAMEASLSIGKAALRTLALCLAQELEPENIHVATLAVCGFVQPGPFSAEHVAEAFWQLHQEKRGQWTFERILRPA